MEHTHHENEKLPEKGGVIYNLIGWLATNKTTVYLFIFIILLVGTNIFNNLPKEQFPDIVIPQMIVQTIYAGASPIDVENLINKPIEKQLKSVSGIKRLKSNALQDVSVISVEFNTDIKVEVAKQRVKDAVDKAQKDLPKDLTKTPSVSEVSFSEFPVMNINLAGNFPLSKLKNYAEILQDDIEAFPEIIRVDIIGELKREIQINLDLPRMQAAGISFTDVQYAIQGENINVSGGEINVGDVRRMLRVNGEFKNMLQIQNLMVRSAAGATVRLSEIAEVIDGFEEKQDYARLNKNSVITLNVIKRGGG